MSKMTIEWHRQGVANTERHLAEEEASIERDLKRLEARKLAFNFYRAQLDEAERRRLDGFDADRFMVVKRSGTK